MKASSLFLHLLVYALLLCTHSAAAQYSDIKSFMFGHSLMDHRPPIIATPSDETTIAHWIYSLATAAGKTYSASGQYGFLPQHQNLPPSPQWGYDIVPGAWDSDVVPNFADADFNNVLITAGNFMQWQAPDLEYPGDPGVTPISATQNIVDWLASNEPGIRIYIYENWPDMAPYLTSGTFPPTSSDLVNYYNYLNGDFHDWWIDYHDAILASHPDENVRMIPVGPILSSLLQNTNLQTIPASELYEDDAPHGRATLYFLAGLITYMAIYEDEAPASYTVPSIVHTTVANNYSTIVTDIWNQLLAFNLSGGGSRVFYNVITPVDLATFTAAKTKTGVALNWKTLSEVSNEKFEIEHSHDGFSFRKIGEVQGMNTTTVAQSYSFMHHNYVVGWNYYRLKQLDFDGTFEYSEVVTAEVKNELALEQLFYPNPSSDGLMNLRYFATNDTELLLAVYDMTGRMVSQERRAVSAGKNELSFDFKDLNGGAFVVRTLSEGRVAYCKILLGLN